MPTGLGNRKVLTPRSTKAPRRSLPPQAKLIEAASFDSLDSQPSSPDIMTTKLQEKVKNNNSKKGNNSASASSFNQRLAAAAVTGANTKSSASNSLAANSGRSKLSTEEFKLDDELDEKYHNNNHSQKMNSHNNYNATTSNNTTNTTANNSNKNYTGNNYKNSTTSNYKPSYNSSNNNTSYNSNMSNTHNNNSSYNNYNSNNSYSSNISSSSSYNNPSIINNSFDRWNTSASFNGGESVELLQEQLSNMRRDYEGLKQRFTDLSRLRLSEPEEILEEHKKLSEARDLAAERTIKALQKENEELKKQLQSVKEQKAEPVSTKTLSKSTEKSVNNAVNTEQEQEEDESFLKEIEKILKIYSSFSGLKITPSPSSPLNQWHCEFSSRTGRFNFQLIYESDLNRYQYLPETETEGNEEGRVKDLPQFLATDILITADQMQMFFWRLLDTLSKKKN